MPLLSFLHFNKTDKNVEQLRREIASSTQALQQSFSGEMQQLTKSINLLHAKQKEDTQAIILGMQQLSKENEELLHFASTLQDSAPHITSLSDGIRQIQTQIRGLCSQVEQLAAPKPPKYNGRLDTTLNEHLQISEATATILGRWKDTSGKVKESFSGAMRKIEEVEGSIRDAVTETHLFPSAIEPITEKTRAIRIEREDELDEA